MIIYFNVDKMNNVFENDKITTNSFSASFLFKEMKTKFILTNENAVPPNMYDFL
jgi:hypothetical protein